MPGTLRTSLCRLVTKIWGRYLTICVVQGRRGRLREASATKLVCGGAGICLWLCQIKPSWYWHLIYFSPPQMLQPGEAEQNFCLAVDPYSLLKHKRITGPQPTVSNLSEKTGRNEFWPQGFLRCSRKESLLCEQKLLPSLRPLSHPTSSCCWVIFQKLRSGKAVFQTSNPAPAFHGFSATAQSPHRGLQASTQPCACFLLQAPLLRL